MPSMKRQTQCKEKICGLKNQFNRFKVFLFVTLFFVCLFFQINKGIQSMQSTKSLDLIQSGIAKQANKRVPRVQEKDVCEGGIWKEM